MTYTKGETAGGWTYILRGKLPIALVHPKHVDTFLAAPKMAKALKLILEATMFDNYLPNNRSNWRIIREGIIKALPK